jgi:hypothetical protein
MPFRTSVNPHYRPMATGENERPSVPGAKSDTQVQLAEMRSGERWSLTATERTYNAGGIQNGPMTGGSPQQHR